MKASLLLLALPSATAFSALSGFTRPSILPRSSIAAVTHHSASITMYDSSRDPPSSPELNSWHVLATTERWISATLADQNNNGATASNPYSRKEVAYACESFGDSPMIVASVFARLREVRELGEKHAKAQLEMLEEVDDEDYEPKTLRQTQVVVIPGNTYFRQSFATFDNVIRTINEARRQARDFVIQPSSQQVDDDDWSISINCAHMHPDFGQLTKEQELDQLKNESDEVDVNYLEYQQRKLQARRSPYPTIVLEVRATPPPDFRDAPASPQTLKDKEGVTSTDIAALEALFGKSAHIHDDDAVNSDKLYNKEEQFYDAIAQNLDVVSAVTPLEMAKQWMIQHDDEAINKAQQVAFTDSDTEHVDAAYEYMFTNIAMMRENPARQYLVMPNFLPTSATSLEKFGTAAQNIMSVMPELDGKIVMETFHPEHIDPAKRSPMPVIALELKD